MFAQFPGYHSHGRGSLRRKVPPLESNRVKEYDYSRIFRVSEIALKTAFNLESHMCISPSCSCWIASGVGGWESHYLQGQSSGAEHGKSEMPTLDIETNL